MAVDMPFPLNESLRSSLDLSDVSSPGASRGNIGAQAQMNIQYEANSLFHTNRGDDPTPAPIKCFLPEVLHSDVAGADVADDNSTALYLTPYIPTDFFTVAGRALEIRWESSRGTGGTDCQRSVQIMDWSTGGWSAVATVLNKQVYAGTSDFHEEGKVKIWTIDDIVTPGTLRLVIRYDWCLVSKSTGAAIALGKAHGSTLSDEGSAKAPQSTLTRIRILGGRTSGTCTSRVYARSMRSVGK